MGIAAALALELAGALALQLAGALALQLAASVGLAGSEVGMARVPGGFYAAQRSVAAQGPEPVAAFALDVRAVTNAEFLAFATREASWRRTRERRTLADPAYLSSWGGISPLAIRCRRMHP